MGKASRSKGVAGELEVAHLFQRHGFDCDRTPNSGGLRILGDLHGTVPAHVEVKRQETARPWIWFEQAQREAPAGVVPIVAFRRNRSDWLAIAPLEELARMMAAAGAAVAALETIAANAEGWHGPPGDRGHERSLGVIAATAREALKSAGAEPPAA